MSKLKYILPLTLMFVVAIPAVTSFAYSYSVYPDYGKYRYEIYDIDPVPVVTKTTYSDGPYLDIYARLLRQSQAIYDTVDDAMNAAFLDDNLDFNMSLSTWSFKLEGSYLFGAFVNNTGGDLPYYEPPEPDEPVAGDTWLSDMWEWVLWQLGFNDDYSGDLISITGGDMVNTEIVTPTPSPTPTPTPSPTPFTLDIVDNNGNPIYTITGIPNQTIIINQGDNVDNGSDFDIFEVDQIIGDGGAVSPRDGINDVMETNNDYIQDMDISSVQNSFSVLPADWLLMIGVLASLPFIAGFIAKLLK